MRKIFVFIFATMMGTLMVSFSHARPPSAIELEYQLDTKILSYSIKHVTKNPRDHHIRKVVVYLNDEQVDIIRFVTQTTNQSIDAELKLEAKAGDLIRLKAICNKAGIKEAEFKVVDPALSQDTSYQK